MSISEVVRKYEGCKKCNLYKGIFHYVWYRGSEGPVDILFLGEAPGKMEDLSGKPFVGKSGDLLDHIIADTGLQFTYGITNIVCCIPKTIDEMTGKVGVRPPTKDEAEACRGRLLEVIMNASPSLIVLLGKTAKKYIKLPKSLRDIPVVELVHPAYVLRNGGRNSLEYKRCILYLQEACERYLNGVQKKACEAAG